MEHDSDSPDGGLSKGYLVSKTYNLPVR
ncbi:unnamed protein product [Debaryomyces tyrocola]|nr:unnamed protein product [Debaryomyces tyrocola]